jgi:hypothetical protein
MCQQARTGQAGRTWGYKMIGVVAGAAMIALKLLMIAQLRSRGA